MLPIVKQGGTIVIAAALDQGIGSPEFRSLFTENADLDTFMRRILGKDYFVLDQWQLEKLGHVCRKARPRFVTQGLDSATMKGLFVDSVPSVEQAIAEALTEYGPNARIAVVPKARTCCRSWLHEANVNPAPSRRRAFPPPAKQCPIRSDARRRRVPSRSIPSRPEQTDELSLGRICRDRLDKTTCPACPVSVPRARLLYRPASSAQLCESALNSVPVSSPG